MIGAPKAAEPDNQADSQDPGSANESTEPQPSLVNIRRSRTRMATVPLMTLLNWGRGEVARAGLSGAEAEWLLRWATGFDSLVMAPQDVGIRAAETYRSGIAQRRSRIPLQHIMGEMAFRHLTLKAGPGVFNVRPETEMLVELAINAFSAWKQETGNASGKLADLCAGSGAVGLSIAKESQGAHVTLVEIEPKAMTYLETNVSQCEPYADDSSVRAIQGDALSELVGEEGTFAVVASNPPYVAASDPVEQPEALTDPEIALYGGGEDGLVVPRGIVGRAFELLKSGGTLVLEHSEAQARALVDHALAVGFAAAKTCDDLTGRPRFLVALKGGGPKAEDVRKLVEAGELIVVPTDTVYGIGADPFSHEAVDRLLAAKGRGETMPPPVLVADVESLIELAKFDSDEERRRVRALGEAFLPGPLTLIVKTSHVMGWDTKAVGGTIAVRVPDHPVTLEILRQIGPLAVTSANRTSMPPATSVQEARGYFGEDVRFYVDGGPTPDSIPSTILDCTATPWKIVRQGALGWETIERFVEDGSSDCANESTAI